MLNPKSRTAPMFTAAALVLALALVPLAVAGKSRGGGGNNGAPAYTGSITGPVTVVDRNGDGSVTVGDSITFNVSSTAAYPFVSLSCSQNGSQVSHQTLGFFGSWSRTFYLGGMVWTGGAADCVATLYSQSATGAVEPTEATLGFHVNG